jgi:hypothetical protein
MKKRKKCRKGGRRNTFCNLIQQEIQTVLEKTSKTVHSENLAGNERTENEMIKTEKKRIWQERNMNQSMKFRRINRELPTPEKNRQPIKLWVPR